MLRQYRAQRHRPNTRCNQGTIDVGTIVYIQEPQGLRSRYHRSSRVNPWIVEAWHNRECMGAYLTGGHLATVRSLRDGRRVQVADWLLLASIEAAGDWYPRRLRLTAKPAIVRTAA